MSNLNKFEEITPDIIKKCGVQSLADRPNQPSRYGEGGLTAGQLKLRFDRLATEIINKYNLIVKTLSNPKVAASYIAWRVGEGEKIETLASFFEAALEGDSFANELVVNDEGETLATVLTQINNYITTLKIGIADGSLAAAMKVIVTETGGTEHTDTIPNYLGWLQGEISGATADYEDLSDKITKTETSLSGKITATETSLSGKITATEGSIKEIKQDYVSKAEEGEQSLSGALYVPKITASDGVFDEVVVNGDLFVSGTSYAIDKQALTVRDNIIVVNASTQLHYENSEPFDNSGIVINTGKKGADGTYEAYGILYQPNGNDAVYIGKGKLRYEDDDGLEETEYDARSATFTFDEGEAIPLAARLDGFTDGVLPVWDAKKNAFKPSGIDLGEVGRDITEWDYEITDKSQFTTKNLAKMSGNVLVKCDIRLVGGSSEPIEVFVPQSIKVLNLNGHALDVDLTGHEGCRLMNAHFEVGDNWEAGYEQYVRDFGSVEFCRGAGVYFNCGRIAHSDIWRASSCDFITDVKTRPYEYEDTVFSGCTNITNVKVSDITNDESASNVEFDSCSYISNVSFVGDRDGVIKYYNCKYVDALTCHGYKAFYYDDEAESDVQLGASYGVPCIAQDGTVSFLERAEGGSYGS